MAQGTNARISVRSCTVPAILGLREWFESRFGDMCRVHDYAYVRRLGKWKADMAFLKRMQERGYWWLVPPTFFFFMTIGFWYYYT
jgi:hypothetical protein